jgi:hypothetical protein
MSPNTTDMQESRCRPGRNLSVNFGRQVNTCIGFGSCRGYNCFIQNLPESTIPAEPGTNTGAIATASFFFRFNTRSMMPVAAAVAPTATITVDSVAIFSADSTSGALSRGYPDG